MTVYRNSKMTFEGIAEIAKTLLEILVKSSVNMK